MTQIVNAFLAAIEAGVPQEDAGRQAAEANIDMLASMVAEQIPTKTGAAVASRRTRQAQIAQRWGDLASPTLTDPSDTGLAQPAQASLNTLIAVTGGLIWHGRHPITRTPTSTSSPRTNSGYGPSPC